MTGNSRPKADNDPWVPLEISESAANVLADLHGPSTRLPVPQNPHYQMIDSEKYIQSLEQKLSKLTKKRQREPTSRDIINSLAVFHEDQMRRYIDDSTCPSPHTNGVVLGDGSMQSSFLHRRLYPERQPLNLEEIAELLKEDVVAERFEELAVDADAINANAWANTDIPTTQSEDPKLRLRENSAEASQPEHSLETESVSVSHDRNINAASQNDNWADFDQFNEGSKDS